MRMLVALTFFAIAFSGMALAGAPVPEINSGQALNAFALLSGAILVIRGRRRK
jgi:hypothetical protein